ncbi:hypothetical protein RYX36_002144, partial [Vicia faba]
FGEIDIDDSFVTGRTTCAGDIMLLNNGFLCCTASFILVGMIYEIVSLKKRIFDQIIIETTGLANLASIIKTFYVEENIFNEVVTLVDLKYVGLHLYEVIT